MISLQMSLNIGGDSEVFARAGKRLRDLGPFMRSVGENMVGKARTRLSQVLRQGEGMVRTGDLMNSLMVFASTPRQVVWGSNVPYAAQVNFGGTIVPRTVRALAIPLSERLIRDKMWPRDLDPERTLLRFVPTRGKPNIIGVLVNPERETSKSRKLGKSKRGKKRGSGGMLGRYPVGPLFALATSVTQRARPFLYLDETDEAEVGQMFNDWITA